MYENSAALLRVLAATLAGRSAIALGPIPTDHVVALLAGLDITSRLIVSSGSDSQMRVLGSDVPEDLRLSLHVQSLDEFLDDIAAHQFGLTIVTDEGMPVLERALEMVDVGGIVVGLSGVGSFPFDSRFESVTIGREAISWLATRRQHARPVRRRRRVNASHSASPTSNGDR